MLPRGDYARGLIASFINRAFGRVSLRGLARAQHAALTAATGSKQHAAGRLTSVGTRGGGGDVRNSAADRAQGGSMRVHPPSAGAGVARSRAGS